MEKREREEGEREKIKSHFVKQVGARRVIAREQFPKYHLQMLFYGHIYCMCVICVCMYINVRVVVYIYVILISFLALLLTHTHRHTHTCNIL